ncbi:MAG TPA: S9 family peptidase [Candidatus Acidoferrum sp.]|jgi:dipeptidyl aminopeptidase/acylaminoacyl peptidase|nr:S9 family peptidase [Candidatus Acidoferrum sp.]
MKNRLHAAFAVLFLAFTFPALAQESASKPAPATPRSITIDDFFQIRDVSQPELSPDSQWVAYAVRTRMLKEDKNEQRLWMISTHGGDALPLTAEGVTSSHPRWSPDGKYLSFLSARDGGKSQVWLLDRRGGEAQRLTETAQGVDDFEWSPDSSRIVLILRDPKPEDLEAAKEKDKEKGKPAAAAAPKPKTPPPFVIDRLQFKRDTVGYLDRRRTHLYVFTVSAKTTVQITSGDFDDTEPAWSPDGKSLAFTSNRSTPDPDATRDSNIWVVAADNTDKGAHLTQITTNPAPDASPTWSPDGKSIAYVTELDPHLFYYSTRHLAIAPAGGGEARVLTLNFDRSIHRPRFSSDGRSIYFIAEDDGMQSLCRIAVTGGEMARPIGGRLPVAAYSLGKDGSLAAQISTIDRPDEIFILPSDAKEPTRLTKTNDALFSQLRLAQADYVHFKSKDGTSVAGYLYKPLDYAPGKKVPTLLNPHGGPVGQYTASFYHLAQLYAAKGYAVLLPNPRGSSGYGQKFCAAIYADWGNKDYQDDVAMVDYAVSQGLADPDKLGVGGWSYGGISTDFIIAQTSRFKAAISGAGVALIPSFYGHDHYQLDYEIELGHPWENKAVWEKISPFYRVANITTPTLFMGGDIDWNVPILGSEQMYEAMKTLGRTTELVVYPGEYHGFTVPSHIKDRLERYLAWYGHYVKGESTPARPPEQPAPAAKPAD